MSFAVVLVEQMSNILGVHFQWFLVGVNCDVTTKQVCMEPITSVYNS